MNPNNQQNQPFQSSVPPQVQAQYQQQGTVSGSMLPHSSKLPLILAIVFGLLFVVALVFGLWAFVERQDYKDNSDAKSAVAVDAALAEQKDTLSAEFAEQAKEPFLTYNGPSTYGSFSFEYPRTWSVYVEESSNSSDLYNVYMHPNEIRDIDDREAEHAFLLEIVGNEYEKEINSVANDVERGDLSSAAYRPDKVLSALGIRVKGELDNNTNGTRVYLPIRDRTLILTTETDNYLSDFERILTTLTFTP